MRWSRFAFLFTIFSFTMLCDVRAQQTSPPKSQAEILKTLNEKREKLDASLEEMKKKYANAVAEAEKETVSKLQKRAQSESTSGEIAEAIETWTNVLEIDSTNVEAKKFFRSIGRLDIVEKLVAEAETKRITFPQRRSFWQAENGITFRQLPDGTWLESWTTKDRQKIHREVGRSPYHIELFNRTGSSRVQHILYPDHYFWKPYLDKKWQLDPAVAFWKE